MLLFGFAMKIFRGQEWNHNPIVIAIIEIGKVIIGANFLTHPPIDIGIVSLFGCIVVEKERLFTTQRLIHLHFHLRPRNNFFNTVGDEVEMMFLNDKGKCVDVLLCKFRKMSLDFYQNCGNGGRVACAQFFCLLETRKEKIIGFVEFRTFFHVFIPSFYKIFIELDFRKSFLEEWGGARAFRKNTHGGATFNKINALIRKRITHSHLIGIIRIIASRTPNQRGSIHFVFWFSHKKLWLLKDRSSATSIENTILEIKSCQHSSIFKKPNTTFIFLDFNHFYFPSPQTALSLYH